MCAVVHPYFRRRRMAQETKWTCGSGVRTRLEDPDQVSNFSARQADISRQSVEWSTKWSNDIHFFLRRHVEFVHQCHRIISLDGLPQVARSRKMMVHATVDNQELLTARNLDVVHASDVDAGFTDEKTSGLDQELRASEEGFGFYSRE